MLADGAGSGDGSGRNPQLIRQGRDHAVPHIFRAGSPLALVEPNLAVLNRANSPQGNRHQLSQEVFGEPARRLTGDRGKFKDRGMQGIERTQGQPRGPAMKAAVAELRFPILPEREPIEAGLKPG